MRYSHRSSAVCCRTPGSAFRDEDFERYALMSTGVIQPVAGDSLMPGTGDPVEVFAVGRVPERYDPAGALRGIAAEGGASGYADVVRVLYAYDPERQAITGLGVVGMRETPGIGDKIITDADFLANFVALDARLNADGSALANPIRVVKHGSKRNPWEIDAISGATVTSKAVGKGINDSAQRLLPRLAPHLDKVRSR